MEQQEMIQIGVGLASGLVGGNVAGLVFKGRSLGAIGNSVLGAGGGALAAYILKTVNLIPAVDDPTQFDLTTTVYNVVAGLAGGGALISAISIFKGKSKGSAPSKP
jgi:hypothetical protein